MSATRRLLLLAAALGIPGAAQAQSQRGPGIQHLVPASDDHGGLVAESPRTLEMLTPSFGLLANHAYRPLTFWVDDPSGESVLAAELVQQHTAMDVQAALGFEHAQLALHLPVNAYMSGAQVAWGDDAFGSIPGASAGDLRLVAKGRILDSGSDPIGLGVALPMSLPTGAPLAYSSNQSVTLSPALLGEVLAGGFRGTVNLGGRIRTGAEPLELPGLSVRNEFLYGLGLGYSVLEDADLLAELWGAAGGQGSSSPVEWAAGARIRPDNRTSVLLTSGTGIGRGYGAPALRVQLGVRYSFGGELDRDGDGYVDTEDTCPDEAEDFDEFEDLDGCPDDDNDGDGIADADDQCRDEAETVNAVLDGDGCPEGDRDGDGLVDPIDQCPDQPETVNGIDDADGCPENDNDGDGFVNAVDQCPDEPETVNGVQDDDGCPETDADGDGLVDAVDDCPDEPELWNGFEDDDGCPEQDADNDGIIDAKDDCVNEAEVYNGKEDDDGCPDEALVEIIRSGATLERIKILERVHFETGKAVLKTASYPVLNAVASAMQAYPEILVVEIQGHTDDVGGEDTNYRLSQGRAESVLTYLASQGTDPERLKPVGYGETKPVVPNSSKENRAENRRVEFVVLEQAE